MKIIYLNNPKIMKQINIDFLKQSVFQREIQRKSIFHTQFMIVLREASHILFYKREEHFPSVFTWEN